MINTVIHIPLTPTFKKEAMEIINSTIDKVLTRHNSTLSDKDKKKIKNLSLDQINVNVTHKSKLKTIWVFDTEDNLPVVLHIDENISLPDNPEIHAYKLRSNGEWEIDLDNEESLNKKDFESAVLKYLISDFETASFYGTLSYMDDAYEK